MWIRIKGNEGEVKGRKGREALSMNLKRGNERREGRKEGVR